MSEMDISCQVTCQRCGWNTGVTLHSEEASVFDSILNFIRCSWHQHGGSETTGKLIILWQPREAASS